MKPKVFALFTVLVAIFAGGITSCDKSSDDIQISTLPEKELAFPNQQPSVVRELSASTLDSRNFDEIYEVDISNYTHVYQEGDRGMCGPCSYVSARSIKNPSYSATYTTATTIKSRLDSIHGTGAWGVYQLYAYRDRTSKDWGRWRSPNNMWTSARDNAKAWIKQKISEGKPCVLPCLYNMSTSTSSIGHFYVIVSLYLKNDGYGSIVGVKDVWRNNSQTFYFSYTDLLSSNWVNTRKYSGVGREHYAVMSFE